MKRVFWIILWLIGPAALVASSMIFNSNQNPVNRDFANMWVAGQLVVKGNFAGIFDPLLFPKLSSNLLSADFRNNNYSYPPHALLIAVPFALIPYWLSFCAWNLAGVLFFTSAARRWCPDGFPWFLAALTPAGVFSVFYGHYGLLYGGLWLLVFSAPPVRAGLCAALLTFKPHLGLLAAAETVRHRSTFLAAALGTLILVALSALIFGPESWTAFFTATLAFQTNLISDDQRFKLFFEQVAPLITYGWPGQMLFACAAGYLVSRNFNVFTAATATFLIVPYGFHYDMTVASLGFAILLYRHFEDMPAWHRLAMTFGFISPALVMLGNYLVAPILLLGLMAQTRYSVDGGIMPIRSLIPFRSLPATTE